MSCVVCHVSCVVVTCRVSRVACVVPAQLVLRFPAGAVTVQGLRSRYTTERRKKQLQQRKQAATAGDGAPVAASAPCTPVPAPSGTAASGTAATAVAPSAAATATAPLGPPLPPLKRIVPVAVARPAVVTPAASTGRASVPATPVP